MDFECKKGWIITLDKNGNYVPFFIKVREKDILWTNSNTSMDDIKLGLIRDLNKGEYKTAYVESSIINPSQILVMKVDGWTYKIKPDYTFEANKNLLEIPYTSWNPIYKSVSKGNNKENYLVKLTYDIKLPFKAKTENIDLHYNLLHSEPLCNHSLLFHNNSYHNNQNNDTLEYQKDHDEFIDRLTLELHDIGMNIMNDIAIVDYKNDSFLKRFAEGKGYKPGINIHLTGSLYR